LDRGVNIGGVSASVKVASRERDPGACRKTSVPLTVSPQNNFGGQSVASKASQCTDFPQDEAVQSVVNDQMMSGDVNG
jgi:hypothetical protein